MRWQLKDGEEKRFALSVSHIEVSTQTDIHTVSSR